MEQHKSSLHQAPSSRVCIPQTMRDVLRWRMTTTATFSAMACISAPDQVTESGTLIGSDDRIRHTHPTHAHRLDTCSDAVCFCYMADAAKSHFFALPSAFPADTGSLGLSLQTLRQETLTCALSSKPHFAFPAPAFTVSCASLLPSIPID